VGSQGIRRRKPKRRQATQSDCSPWWSRWRSRSPWWSSGPSCGSWSAP